MATGTDLAIRRLVLIGATGGIEDPAGRAGRRQADEATAAALEASGDVDAFIARWVSGPMFARLADAAQTVERRRNSAAGLASSLRLAGTGTQEPLWDRIPDLAVPLLALAGTDDTRFAAHALRLVRSAPHGVASLIPGGGHAVHLAQPDPRRAPRRSLARYGLTRRSPTVSRTPTASCRRAVAASIGRSALPFWSLRASRAGRTARGSAARAMSAQPR